MHRVIKCPPDMAAGFLPSKESNRKQSENNNDFHDLVLKATVYHLHNKLLILEVSVIHCRSELQKDMNNRK